MGLSSFHIPKDDAQLRMNHGYYNRGGKLLWIDIEYAVACMAQNLQRHNAVPKAIFGVARGGLIPAVMLSHLLKVPYGGSLLSRSYDEQDKLNLRATEMSWDPRAEHLLNDHNCLVIDDLWDSGSTHKAFKTAFPDGVFATLFYKERRQEPRAHFIVNFPGLALREGEWVDFPWEAATNGR